MQVEVEVKVQKNRHWFFEFLFLRHSLAVGDWEFEFYYSTIGVVIGDRNRTPMCFDNSLAYPQPQPVAADFL